ncbi:Uncharacterized protein Rs2_12216 [Raphanus sativus]|nr:Uncharacterized protein Rs2_12216 [Raphanus sativus]
MVRPQLYQTLTDRKKVPRRSFFTSAYDRPCSSLSLSSRPSPLFPVIAVFNEIYLPRFIRCLTPSGFRFRVSNITIQSSIFRVLLFKWKPQAPTTTPPSEALLGETPQSSQLLTSSKPPYQPY